MINSVGWSQEQHFEAIWAPAVTQEWRFASLATSADLINKVFEILAVTVETCIQSITSCRLRGEIVRTIRAGANDSRNRGKY